MIDIFLIRHGESEANLTPEIICGQSPHIELSPRGRAQAKALGKRFAAEELEFDRVFSSPAQRAIETANLACKDRTLPTDGIVLDEDLLEVHRGDWEGLSRNGFFTAEVEKEYRENPHTFCTPGGESHKDLERRMRRWLDKVMTNTSGETKVAAFSHSRAIKCLVRDVLDWPASQVFTAALFNTAIVQLRYTDLGWHLMRYNDAAHLHEIGVIDTRRHALKTL